MRLKVRWQMRRRRACSCSGGECARRTALYVLPHPQAFAHFTPMHRARPSLVRLQAAKLELSQIEADLRKARDDARRKKHPVTESDRLAWRELPQDIYQLDCLIAECKVTCENIVTCGVT